MKTLIQTVLFSALLTSCVEVRTNKEMFPLIAKQKDFIAQECRSISQTGNIWELIRTIDWDTRKVLELIGTVEPKLLEAAITPHAEAIKANSAKVIELSKSEWTTPNIVHEINWVLTAADFDKQPLRELYVYHPKVVKVYLNGVERKDLIRFFEIDQNGNWIKVIYQNYGSLLEYCQLNETLMVILEYKQESYRSTLIKYFNLVVNKGNLT